ncbi:adenylyltransferase/cytidyltransferase family protein [Candidatus Sororendozoicomonas aggregata]|uniref:adenylyltransferase/cytidyltransferase family protein n=1 Tax=Candidatus Sororendozoicomonas aggregata TaxID=3073239 RepID=UPI002ED3C8C5
MKQLQLGVFGSAFDPPTRGHLDVIRQSASHFDSILLVPSASHAFAKKMQSFEHRIAMLQAFMEALGNVGCHLELCFIEAELLKKAPDQPVYTFDVLSALEAQYCEDIAISFIRGPDNADPQVWHSFYKARAIERRWGIFTAQQQVSARSSQVRALMAGQGPGEVTHKLLAPLLLPTVSDYILRNGLYLEESQ